MQRSELPILTDVPLEVWLAYRWWYQWYLAWGAIGRMHNRPREETPVMDNCIFAVMRQWGEYSDWSIAPICWRATEAEAKEMAYVLEREIALVRKMNSSDYMSNQELERRRNMMQCLMQDPEAASLYVGDTVRYTVWKIPDNAFEGSDRYRNTLALTTTERSEVEGLSMEQLLEKFQAEDREAGMDEEY